MSIKKNVVLLLVVALVFTGCVKPYQQKVYKEIQPNQTAYLIPLTGANKSNQGAFDSEDYLNEKKVASKRIEIRTKWLQTGRRSYQGKYINEDKLIVVTRTPVTAKWDDIKCESSESVEWLQSVTLTAFIEEVEASKFLYMYGGKSLQKVVDEDARAMVSKIMSREFSKYTLVQARTKKGVVYEILEREVAEAFEPYGITIRSIGANGGFNYTDKSIQVEINKEFASTLAKKTAKNNADAAKEFEKASIAMEAKQRVENIRMIGEAQAEAIKIKASKWNGAYPSTVTFLNSGEDDMSKFLMSLDK